MLRSGPAASARTVTVRVALPPAGSAGIVHASVVSEKVRAWRRGTHS